LISMPDTPGAGHAALAPSPSVPGQRTHCQRRANHRDLVTTSQMPGGEPGPIIARYTGVLAAADIEVSPRPPRSRSCSRCASTAVLGLIASPARAPARKSDTTRTGPGCATAALRGRRRDHLPNRPPR
jgi:hypothetical protein